MSEEKTLREKIYKLIEQNAETDESTCEFVNNIVELFDTEKREFLKACVSEPINFSGLSKIDKENWCEIGMVIGFNLCLEKTLKNGGVSWV
jgi:hypothetical protein